MWMVVRMATATATVRISASLRFDEMLFLDMARACSFTIGIRSQQKFDRRDIARTDTMPATMNSLSHQ